MKSHLINFAGKKQPRFIITMTMNLIHPATILMSTTVIHTTVGMTTTISMVASEERTIQVSQAEIAECGCFKIPTGELNMVATQE